MGRPTKTTADYFPHMTTHKKTMAILEGRWGNDAYAFWFKLLECLGNAPGHYIDCNRIDDWDYLFMNARVSEQLATDILNKLSDLDAIDHDLWINHKVIWSDHFVEGLAQLYKNRKQPLPEKPSFILVSTEETPTFSEETPRNLNKTELNAPIDEFNRKKHAKEEYRKEEKRREESSPSIPRKNTEEKNDDEDDEHQNDFQVIVDLLQKNICLVSNQVESDLIRDWIETMPRDWVTEAIKRAALAKARYIKYVDNILQGWVSKYKLDDKPWEVETDGRSRKNGLPGSHRRDPTPDEYERDRSKPGW